MADEEQISDGFVSIVSSFLLNPEIRDDCTFEEFKSYFPSRYRSHNDVTHLHEAFVMKRKIIKESVRQHIEEFYKVSPTKQRKAHQQNQNMKEVVAVLEMKRKELNEELLKAKNDLEILRDNMERCDKAVENCHIMKTDSKKFFDMGIFKKLDGYLSEAQQGRVSSQRKET